MKCDNIFFSLNGIIYVRALMFRENQINHFLKEEKNIKNTLNPNKRNNTKNKSKISKIQTRNKVKSQSVNYEKINIKRKFKSKNSKFIINLISFFFKPISKIKY